ncbi:50S ribosome-binding GTPase [Moorena producens JHB]|uniref:50S ribosome-binding GTPase n=1 Tax=Moorena producens (strain JHB) TaxID=1454205 RepID=A0A1D9FW93_MOOP1|nr:GTPase [Moorena producens]AOY79544.1 50S ribosome-binding GTPase [Moorena producens JHB]
MNNTDKTVIAVTGHTNSGKTTLIRTLTKSNVGIVDDRAHVTITIETISYNTLQAFFLDCPGFEVPDSCLAYMRAKKQGLSPEILANIFPNVDRMKYDLIAIEGVEQADVVIYVVDTLNDVPETGHDQEIELLKELNKPIIGIGNKSRKKNDQHGKRITKWEDFFKINHINHYIMFDGWWDNPSKVTRIYSYVENLLSGQKKERYRIDLENFRHRQLEILREASDLMYDCIQACSKAKRQKGIDNTSPEKDLIDEIRDEVKQLLEDFNENVSRLYKLAADDPLKGVNDLNFHKKNFSKPKDVVDGAAAGTGIGTGIGGVIGGIIGFLIGLPVGGVAAGPAALVGIQVGATVVGLLGGSIWAVLSVNNNIEVSIDQNGKNFIATTCLAIIWGVSYHGYGNSPTIGEQEIVGLLQTIKNFQDNRYIVWDQLRKKQVFEECKQFFDKIEGRL